MTTDKDWTGIGRASVFKTLGASNHTDHPRAERDYYATDPNAAEMLIDIEHLTPDTPIWEPAAGEGHLADVFTERGFGVYMSDILSRREGIAEGDFLQATNTWHGNIITNPPYAKATEFVLQALRLVADGCKVSMFLKLTFLEGKGRWQKIFSQFPPQRVWVSSQRILCAINGDFDAMRRAGGSAAAYAWFVWEKGSQQKYTEVKWFNP